MQQPNNIQNVNRYSYVLNNPLNKTDPSGYFFQMLVVWAVQYVAAAAATSAIGTALSVALTAYQYYGYAQMAIGAVKAIEGGGTAMANFAGGMAKGYAKGAVFNAVMGDASELGTAHAAERSGAASDKSAAKPVNNKSGTASTDGYGQNNGKMPAPPTVIQKGGDIQSVQSELAKLPPDVLDRLAKAGVSIIVVKDSVTEYFEELKGVTPRGWPEGLTWDTVPGLYDQVTKSVVVATSGKFGAGSFSLTLHEVAHAYDHVMSLSGSKEFRLARAGDIRALDRYQMQPGNAGLEETFAESFANFYGGNQNYNKSNPNLYNYWSKHK